MNWAHGIKSCFRCLQWDHWFSYSFLGVIYTADGPELWEKSELLLLVAVWGHSDTVGIYSCWNTGCKNSLSLDCVRPQSSITSSITSSWVSHSYHPAAPLSYHQLAHLSLLRSFLLDFWTWESIFSVCPPHTAIWTHQIRNHCIVSQYLM